MKRKTGKFLGKSILLLLFLLQMLAFAITALATEPSTGQSNKCDPAPVSCDSCMQNCGFVVDKTRDPDSTKTEDKKPATEKPSGESTET